MNRVGQGRPFQNTIEPGTKPFPATSKVPAPPPAAIVEKLNPVREGTALITEKFSEFDVPPPGVGLMTVIGKLPADAINAAGTDAVNKVELWKVVVRFVVPQRITAPLTKFDPLTPSVKLTSPAKAVEGFRLVKVGVGLLIVTVPPVKIR